MLWILQWIGFKKKYYNSSRVIPLSQSQIWRLHQVLLSMIVAYKPILPRIFKTGKPRLKFRTKIYQYKNKKNQWQMQMAWCRFRFQQLVLMLRISLKTMKTVWTRIKIKGQINRWKLQLWMQKIDPNLHLKINNKSSKQYTDLYKLMDNCLKQMCPLITLEWLEIHLITNFRKNLTFLSNSMDSLVWVPSDRLIQWWQIKGKSV